jgi:hypothetical protein
MNRKIIYVILSLVTLTAIIASFLCGVYWGQGLAKISIKSELVWYNQNLLKQAVDDIKNGQDAEAEKKILYVDKELEKMKENK